MYREHAIRSTADSAEGTGLNQTGARSNSTTSVPSPVHPEEPQQRPPPPRSSGEQRPLPHRQETTTTGYESDVVHTVVSTSHDALGLLFKAVEQQEADDGRASRSAPDLNGDDSPATVSSIRGLPITPSNLVTPPQHVLALWKRHRFVKQGWLSAAEAATYVELCVYENLSKSTTDVALVSSAIWLVFHLWLLHFRRKHVVSSNSSSVSRFSAAQS
jgi:hypothetical protein